MFNLRASKALSVTNDADTTRFVHCWNFVLVKFLRFNQEPPRGWNREWRRQCCASTNPMDKISNFDNVSLYFWRHQKKWKIISRRDLNQRAKATMEIGSWWKLLEQLAKMTTVKDPVANMYVSMNSFLVNGQQKVAISIASFQNQPRAFVLASRNDVKLLYVTFLHSNSDIRTSLKRPTLIQDANHHFQLL